MILDRPFALKGKLSAEQKSLEIEHKLSQKRIPVVFYDEEAREILIFSFCNHTWICPENRK